MQFQFLLCRHLPLFFPSDSHPSSFCYPRKTFKNPHEVNFIVQLYFERLAFCDSRLSRARSGGEGSRWRMPLAATPTVTRSLYFYSCSINLTENRAGKGIAAFYIKLIIKTWMGEMVPTIPRIETSSSSKPPYATFFATPASCYISRYCQDDKSREFMDECGGESRKW